MKETTKNISYSDDVDEFECEVCGIRIEGWSSVEEDLDDGELTYHEYHFNYCPNCGRKIVY